jgi:membrane dipeptidase
VIVDAHTDLLYELAFRHEEEEPFRRLWLPKLREGGVGVQVCPAYVGLDELPELGLRRALQQVRAFGRAVRECPDDAVAVRSAADLDRLEGRLGLMLALEGCEPLGYETELADTFWELGVRMVSLTWNRRNPFADGAAEEGGGGLSSLGRQLVTRLAELGMMIDLAHASERTFFDVLEHVPEATVLVSHANCRALVDSPRNLSDGQLHALAERGGVLGVLVHPFVLREPTIAGVVEQIQHAASVMGDAHVGLGGDFMRQIIASGAVRVPPDALLPDGMPIDAAVEQLSGPEDYPALVEALEAEGYGPERLDAVLGGNWLRLFRRGLP